MKIDLQNALSKIRSLCREQGVTHLVTMDPSNILYLTGFESHGAGDAVLLITPRRVILFSDPRYEGTIDRIVKANPFITKCIWTRLSEVSDCIMQFVEGKDLVLGLELDNKVTSHKFADDLKEAMMKCIQGFKKVTGIIESLRNVKTPAEIAILQEAFEISDRAFEYIIGEIKPGVSETEIAYLLNAFMRRETGCEEIAFSTTVASGPNSAIPHATASSRKFTSQDVITLDYGCKFHDYCTDTTRTIFLGEPHGELRQIYDAVLAAQNAGEMAAIPGATGQDVDRAVRKVLDDAGFLKYFTHSTGHGVGLDPHESLYMTDSKYGEPELQEGNVFTIEPGVYKKGKHGVRIENTGVFTAGEFKPFSRLPKDLLVLKG